MLIETIGPEAGAAVLTRLAPSQLQIVSQLVQRGVNENGVSFFIDTKVFEEYKVG